MNVIKFNILSPSAEDDNILICNSDFFDFILLILPKLLSINNCLTRVNKNLLSKPNPLYVIIISGCSSLITSSNFLSNCSSAVFNSSTSYSVTFFSSA